MSYACGDYILAYARLHTNPSDCIKKNEVKTSFFFGGTYRTAPKPMSRGTSLSLVQTCSDWLRRHAGGAGVIEDEHPSVSVFSPSKASSISSSGIFSMLKGFLLALIIRVK